MNLLKEGDNMMNLYVLGDVFTAKHFSGLFIVLALVVLVIILIERFFEYDDKVIKKILVISAISFLVLEAIKLGTMINDKGSYPMNHLPLHLCSFPLYSITILAFTNKDSKIHKFFIPSAYVTVFLGGFIALLYPVNIIGDAGSWLPLSDNLIPLISFMYHGLMIFVPVVLIRSVYFVPIISDLKNALIATLGFMVIALIANYVFKQDFMLLTEGNGSPFDFLLDTSQILYTGVMIVLGVFLISLFYLITSLVVKTKY